MTDGPDNIIDSRDVIERIAELTNADELTDDERTELDTLTELSADASDNSPDWEYGAALIRDNYFEEYAKGLAEDIGAIDHNATWPMTCIDWQQAARELQGDYTAVDFGGVTYWVC